METERSISIGAIFGIVLRNWRKLIICIVAGVLLFGVFGTVKYKNLNKEEAHKEIDMKGRKAELDYLIGHEPEGDKLFEQYMLDLDLTKADINNLKIAAKYKTMADNVKAYAAKSVMMQLNPYNLRIVRINYLAEIPNDGTQATIPGAIYNQAGAKTEENLSGSTGNTAPQTDTPADTSDAANHKPKTASDRGADIDYIANALCNALKSGPLAEALLTYYPGSSAEAMLELSDATIIKRDSYLRMWQPYQAMLQLEFILPAEAEAETLPKAFDKKIADLTKQLQTDFGYFQVKRANTINLIDSDDSISNRQAKILDLINTYVQKYDSAAGKVPAEVKTLLEFDQKGTEIATEQQKTEKSGLKSYLKKYILLGFVIGMILGVFLCFAGFGYANKVMNSHEFTLFGLDVLAFLTLHNDFAHRLARKLDNNKQIVNNENAIGFAAAAIAAKLQKIDKQEIKFVSTKPEQASKTFQEKFGAALASHDIKFSSVHKVLDDYKQWQQITGEKAVVLYEFAGATEIRELKQELKLLQQGEVEVLGVIVEEA